MQRSLSVSAAWPMLPDEPGQNAFIIFEKSIPTKTKKPHL